MLLIVIIFNLLCFINVKVCDLSYILNEINYFKIQRKLYKLLEDSKMTLGNIICP